MSFKNDDKQAFLEEDVLEIIDTEDNKTTMTKEEQERIEKKLQTIICTKTGTRLENPHPLIIFMDERDCFYLKCRSANANRERLPWEIMIDHAISKNNSTPHFLRKQSYVDISTLFQMRKTDFYDLCTANNVEYAQLDGEYIQQHDRLNILNKLLTNLGYREFDGKSKVVTPDIALINCDVTISGDTAFRVDYCPLHYLEDEIKLFNRGVHLMILKMNQNMKKKMKQ